MEKSQLTFWPTQVEVIMLTLCTVIRTVIVLMLVGSSIRTGQKLYIIYNTHLLHISTNKLLFQL